MKLQTDTGEGNINPVCRVDNFLKENLYVLHKAQLRKGSGFPVGAMVFP